MAQRGENMSRAEHETSRIQQVMPQGEVLPPPVETRGVPSRPGKRPAAAGTPPPGSGTERPLTSIIASPTGAEAKRTGPTKLQKAYAVLGDNEEAKAAAQIAEAYLRTPRAERGDPPEALDNPLLLRRRTELKNINVLQQLRLGIEEEAETRKREEAKEKERAKHTKPVPVVAGAGAEPATAARERTEGRDAREEEIAPTVSHIEGFISGIEIPGALDHVRYITDALRRLEAGEDIDVAALNINETIARIQLPDELGGGGLFRTLQDAVHREWEEKTEAEKTGTSRNVIFTNYGAPVLETVSVENLEDAGNITSTWVLGSMGIAETFTTAPTPAYNANELVSSQVNQEQITGYLHTAAQKVLGEHYTDDIRQDMMPPTDGVMEEGKDVSPAESPYSLGLLRVLTSLAIQRELLTSAPEAEYVAAKTVVNAVRLKLIKEVEQYVDQGFGKYSAEQIARLKARDDDRSKALYKEAIQQTADVLPQTETLKGMEQRLTFFAQMNEFGTQRPLLDDLALVPLLDPGLQWDALNTMLAQAPEVKKTVTPAVERQAIPLSADPELNKPVNEDDLGNLAASLGNHLGKILVLMSMDYEFPHSEATLGREIAELQDSPRGWPSMDTGKNAMAYNLNTLAKIGLVSKIKIEGGYMRVLLNNFGRRIGLPLAGYLAQISEQYPEFKLEDVMGQTGTRANARIKIVTTEDGETREYRRRAAITRLKIYDALLQHDEPLTLHELAAIVGPDFDRTVIGATLASLDAKGIVKFESTSYNRRRSFFELDSQSGVEPEIHGVREQAIMDWIRTTTGPFTIDDFAKVPEHQYLMATYGETISAIFANLARQGVLKRGGMGFDHKAHTSIWLTDRQRDFLTNLTEAFKKVQSGLEENLIPGRDIAADVIRDKERYTALMRKAMKDSRGANAQAKNRSRAQVLEIVRDLPGIDADNIRQAVSHLYDRKFSNIYILSLLQELADEGVIAIEQRAKKNFYTLLNDLEAREIIDEAEPQAVEKNEMGGRWLAPGDALLHERFDGSTLPDSLREQLYYGTGKKGKQRIKDPSYVEAVLTAIKENPEITYMEIHALFESEGYGMDEAMVRRIAYNLVLDGYVDRSRHHTGNGFSLTALNESERAARGFEGNKRPPTGREKVHARYDGSTLPESLRNQRPRRSNYKTDDPAYIEAVLDNIRHNPGTITSQTYVLLNDLGYDISERAVRKIVDNLVNLGYVQRDTLFRRDEGAPLNVVEDKK